MQYRAVSTSCEMMRPVMRPRPRGVRCELENPLRCGNCKLRLLGSGYPPKPRAPESRVACTIMRRSLASSPRGRRCFFKKIRYRLLIGFLQTTEPLATATCAKTRKPLTASSIFPRHHQHFPFYDFPVRAALFFGYPRHLIVDPIKTLRQACCRPALPTLDRRSQVREQPSR